MVNTRVFYVFRSPARRRRIVTQKSNHRPSCQQAYSRPCREASIHPGVITLMATLFVHTPPQRSPCEPVGASVGRQPWVWQPTLSETGMHARCVPRRGHRNLFLSPASFPLARGVSLENIQKQLPAPASRWAQWRQSQEGHRSVLWNSISVCKERKMQSSTLVKW